MSLSRSYPLISQDGTPPFKVSSLPSGSADDIDIQHLIYFHSLSWADTAASTIGRLFGPYTPALPRRVPLLGLPFSPRKSLAGFIAASLTGACVAVGFWGWIAPLGNSQLTWKWDEGIATSLVEPLGLVRTYLTAFGINGMTIGGWLGLGAIGIVAGLVTGIAEALGM